MIFFGHNILVVTSNVSINKKIFKNGHFLFQIRCNYLLPGLAEDESEYN